MRDEHKEVYAAGSTPLLAGNQDLFDKGGSDDSEDKSNYLNMPGYKSMMMYGNDTDDSQQPSYWQNRDKAGTEKDKNHITFARCLLLIYEKAINVQF